MLQKNANYFKKIIYLFIIIKSAYWLLNYNLLFGTNSIVTIKKFSDLGFISDLAFYLYGSAQVNAAYWFLSIALLLGFLGVFKKQIYILNDFLLWLIVINIHNRIYPVLSGGDFLLNQLLFFNIFIGYSHKKTDPSYSVITHNFGVAGIILQLCWVYFIAGWAKLQSEDWMNGNAILLTFKTTHFSNDFFISLIEKTPFLFIFANYFLIAYQLLFPLLIWFKKIKKPMLFVGIVIHLLIAFGMGLVTFGLVMLIPYIFLWPLKQDEQLN